MLRYALEPFIFVSKYIKMLVQEVGYILSNFNQLIVTSILLMYTIIQVTKRTILLFIRNILQGLQHLQSKLITIADMRLL